MRCLIAGVILMTAVPAMAKGLPNWDMRKFCEARVKEGGTADCVQLQNEAKARVKSRWSSVPADIQEDCIAYVEDDDIPPSYMRVDDCLNLKMK